VFYYLYDNYIFIKDLTTYLLLLTISIISIIDKGVSKNKFM
jgi:hypothetical protein